MFSVSSVDKGAVSAGVSGEVWHAESSPASNNVAIVVFFMSTIKWLFLAEISRKPPILPLCE